MLQCPAAVPAPAASQLRSARPPGYRDCYEPLHVPFEAPDPLVVDPSHSGGRRELVLPLSRAAIAIGAEGIIVDVHPHPETALCDGPQALVGSDIEALADAAQHMPPIVGRTLARAPEPVPI